MAKKRSAEAIVIGAGPAGMGTALALIRQGIRVVILEQQELIGAERRGETIRFNEEMESLLGEGFFEKHTVKKINKRTYFSHSGLNEVSRQISNPNHIISWPGFIGGMADILQKEGVEFRLATTVTGFVEEKVQITGVKASVRGATGEEIAGSAVFSCGGHKDPASRYLGTDRSRVDLPVYKQLVSNYQGPDDRLEYYFHIEDGALTIATIFPRGNCEAEIILMGHSAKSSQRQLTMDIFCHEHQKFAARIAGSVPYYKLQTMIPLGGMLSPCSPRPGLIMTGDAMGYVQARGGSGIKDAFLISYTAGTIAAGFLKEGRWSTQEFNIEFEKSPALKSLRRHNLVYSRLRPFMFSRISTPKDMDFYWPLLKRALR